jgi:hypothetical protein
LIFLARYDFTVEKSSRNAPLTFNIAPRALLLSSRLFFVHTVCAPFFASWTPCTYRYPFPQYANPILNLRHYTFCPAISQLRRHAFPLDPRRFSQHHRQRTSSIQRVSLSSRPTSRNHPAWRPITSTDATAHILRRLVQAATKAQACRGATRTE